MLYTRVAFIALSVATNSAVAQNLINAGGGVYDFFIPVGGTTPQVKVVVNGQPNAVEIGIGASPIGGGEPAAVKFKYAGVIPVNTARPTPPNFIVVFPSAGITSTDIFSNPTGVLIGVNLRVVREMSPGTYGLD